MTETKARIFAEYLFCEVVNDNGVRTVLNPSNFYSCIEGDWKLVLDTLFDLPRSLIEEIVEKERFNRRIETIRNSTVPKRVVNHSRNNPLDNNSMMITYMAYDPANPTKKKGLAEGIENWFNIKSSLSVTLLKSKGFDLGSHWYQGKQGLGNGVVELNLIGSEYAVAREYELVTDLEIVRELYEQHKEKAPKTTSWSAKDIFVLDLLLTNGKKISSSLPREEMNKYIKFIESI